jgi:hypothetical protein
MTGAAHMLVTLPFTDTPGSGSFTYKLQVSLFSGSAVTAIDVSNRSVYLLETKK